MESGMAQNSPDIGTHGSSTGSVISSLMTTAEILPLLGLRGCEDITARLDMSKVGPAICNGGFGDVHCGALQNGDQVAIKCLRMFGVNDGDGEQTKLAAHELYVWSKCRHRNILKLHGVANYNNRISMVSPWMANGDLTRYLSNYPEADRYDLCSQVADAVAYLKDNNMVHGDIKGANVLISEDHVPKLTDFGSSALSTYTLSFTAGNGSQPAISLRWTAPEIFIEGKTHTFESDVYALGMTILEAFTGSVPYANLHDRAVMGRLMQKIPPERPQQRIGGEFMDALWIIITSSWDIVPQNRPKAERIRNFLMAIMKAKKFLSRIEIVREEVKSRLWLRAATRQPPLHTSNLTGNLDFQADVMALERDVAFIRHYFDDIYMVLENLEPRNLDRGRSLALSSIMLVKTVVAEAIFSSWSAPTPEYKEWEDIRKEYSHLLLESRRLVTTVAARTENFRTNVIPLLQDSTGSLAEKRRKLEKFIAEMKETDTSAKEISDRFRRIPKRLRGFGISLVHTGYCTKLESGREKITSEMQHLNKKIECIMKFQPMVELEIFLDELYKNISIEGDATGDRIIVAIGKSLADWQEIEFFDKKITRAMRLHDTLVQAKEEPDSKEMDLVRLENGILSLEQLMPYLEFANSSLLHICRRMELIAKIWAVVRTDSTHLHEYLDRTQLESEEAEFRRLILGRTLVSLCENLESILYCYANAVSE
ncbi:hypothetical protein RSOLAG22IIIB_07360 [Rhizoctonia solani]|uniref:Protein kinase domain-containing protein n=1 Tax=Rhizoctonia solani TaxID=456999 RepID=A0A0K6FMD8_9AGAM|nr:hypothetical protein RSOLAG22IIIB_07360 [Rhizoctonia solani]